MYAFNLCTGLKSIEIPNSVISIGNQAFNGCSSLQSFSIPKNVSTINYLSRCTGLTSIEIPNSVTQIGEEAFYGCTGLTSIDIPNSVSIIGLSAFGGTNITSIDIPDSVTEIGVCAFEGCRNLKSITMSENVKKIGDYAFHDCVSLENVDIPEGIQSISEYTFSGCTNLKKVDIPNTVTKIGEGAFEKCWSLSSITLPDNLAYIDRRVFVSCCSLTCIIIPDSVKAILDNAFQGCYGLTSIVIPNNTIKIGNYAFYRCTGLKSVIFPDKSITIGASAFSNCNNIEFILINRASTYTSTSFINLDSSLFHYYFDVVYSEAVNGTVTGITRSHIGEEFEVLVVPNTGYIVDRVYLKYGEDNIVVFSADNGKYLVNSMPDAELATVIATFKEAISITQQPEDYTGLEGTTAMFSVVAEGNSLTYQWQLKKGSSWANLTSGGALTDTMSIKADKSKDGKIYRCFITDADGNTTTTDEVSITIKEPSIVITSQPESYSGVIGSTAKFTVAAEGEGLTYQWQLKKGKSWADLTTGGATTTALSIKVDAAKNGKVYRCLITDANGEQLASEEVTITITEPSITINTQPVNYSGVVGSTAKFTVAAEGEGLTYQWQLKKGSSWANLTTGGATTPTLSIKVDASKDGKTYRCLITAANGEEQASGEAKITVVEPSSDIVITTQPSNYVGLEGSTAKFTVAAEGVSLTYQWQLKKGSSWANLSSGGATTSTLSVKVDSTKNGKIYRCLIKDTDGNELASDGASITIKEPSIFIDTQPEDFEGTAGTIATFTVEARGEGLTYQWQLKKGSKWADLTTGGATTDTLTIKVDSSKNGKVYRCLITDVNGEQLATEEVTIRVVVITFTGDTEPLGGVNTAAEQTVAETPTTAPAELDEPGQTEEPVQGPAEVERIS